MRNSSFHFKLGNFEALVIRDGSSALEWDGFFPEVPHVEFDQTLRRFGFSVRGTMEVMSLLLKTKEQMVLIDTGWGAWSPVSTGRLLQVLDEEGIRREEIDVVINSHGHPDHIGGNADAEGGPAFPRARYIMCRQEWDFWTSDPPLAQVVEEIRRTTLEGVRRNLIPLKDRFELVEVEQEIIPGIISLPAPGHTPYQILLSIASGGERLFCTFDLAHHPIQFLRPSWRTLTDLDPEQAVRSRKEFLSRNFSTDALIFACHFPFPGLGHLIKDRDDWLWRPITP